jgi:signal transduction histidine kinase
MNPFTIRTVLHRSTLYVMAVVAIAIVFFGIEFVIEKWICSNDEIVDIVSAICGAFAFVRLKGFFEILTDRIFFRGQYDYEKAVLRASETLGSTIELEELVGALELFLHSTIKPDRIMFFLKDKKAAVGFVPVAEDASALALMRHYETLLSHAASYFKESHAIVFETGMSADRGGMSRDGPGRLMAEAAFHLDIRSIVPIVYQGRVNALLLLGKKRSGESLSAQDRALLTLLSRQAGMAIENARLYEVVKRHAHGLEQEVVLRTERIKNMYEAQSKFLMEMSHEFQTPIAILRMNLETCMAGNPSQVRNAYYVMATTLDRLSRLTQGLLDIARLKFSKEKFEHRRINMRRLVKEACADCVLLAKSKGIKLSCAVETVFVSGDRDKLKEVLLNLLSNAFKHTPPGGSVVLSARSSEAEVELIVEDSGSGIAPEDMPKIFERFYRMSDDGTSRGTGLGLHLCRRIIEAHGGTITVESKLNEGSRFIIHLPLFEEVL